MLAKKVFVYWEKQGIDRLCGNHCINSLLQGPFFNEVQLSNIALELDEEERTLLGGNVGQGGSNNVADDGNYNIQVLTKALSSIGNLIIESVESQINRNEDLSNETGFICNNSEHWISIRKVENIWYNLNSTNRDGPQIIGEFYLSAFLQSVKENGYTIFVVRGEYPNTRKEEWPNLRANQHFIDAEVIEKFHKEKKTKLNMGTGDENDLEEAIKRSLADQNEGHGMEEEKEEKKEEINYFVGKGIGLGGSVGPKTYPKSGNDPELAFALKLSLEEKAIGEIKGDSVIIVLVYPNGKSVKQLFSLDWNVEDLYDLAKYHLDDSFDYDFTLSYSYPRKKLDDISLTLRSLELTQNERIHISEV